VRPVKRRHFRKGRDQKAEDKKLWGE